MALAINFPKSPYSILSPKVRWFPADEALRTTSMDKLLPPLVANLRKKVKEFRDNNYQGATRTSRALLNWWFQTSNLSHGVENNTNFQYYFAQREALETIIYLYDLNKTRSKYNLLQFDATGKVATGMFDEDWLRFVIKMATGSGKTKVMSLVLVWSFFHKLYEEGSLLARNFLVIAPNIIVLDRIYNDFKGLEIFFKDPLLPNNGFEDHNWQDDFQLTLHKQDELLAIRPTGNIFLTNIHRVYTGEKQDPSPQDANTKEYFLGKKVVGKTTDSKVDLGAIVRGVEELMILNDEAHHIHDEKLAWFQSIKDINNHLVQKGKKLSLQIDVTATPRHNNGAIFVQTICDYPLVEAIAQNVVKHPVIPDSASLAKLKEKQSTSFTQRYKDYIELGIMEWRKTYYEYNKLGIKTILFVMTTDTRECDDVAEYLQKYCSELKDAVLVIHTNNNGDISEAVTGKKQAELDKLRKLAAEIDNYANPYKAVVSVMMLKEGWDVRNVTTIIGLRPYSAKSNILPEQTLGRGLRKIQVSSINQKVSVIGTNAFMEFIKSINNEGVVFERQAMGAATPPTAPLVIEVDTKNYNKDLAKLDIEIPVLSARYHREYKNLKELDLTKFNYKKIQYQKFNKKEQKEIVFRTLIDNEYDHRISLDGLGDGDYRLVIGFFAECIGRDLRLVGGYNILYEKIKEFIQNNLFTEQIKLDDPNTIRNLSETGAINTIIETFKIAINKLSVRETGKTEIINSIKLRKVRPFALKYQDYIIPKKSVFNLICGDSHFELEFAMFLENCEDVLSYTKNYSCLHFKLDYVNQDGNIAHYYPDFIIKQPSGTIIIVETKGLEDLDTPRKIRRLRQWCRDVNAAANGVVYDFVFVDYKNFQTYSPQSFKELITIFTKYKDSNNSS